MSVSVDHSINIVESGPGREIRYDAEQSHSGKKEDDCQDLAYAFISHSSFHVNELIKK